MSERPSVPSTTLGNLQQDLVIDLAGAAVVVADAEGKVKMTSPTHATGAGAASGALWGMIFGLLFLIPVAGLVIGGAMGAIFGKLGDMGIRREFVEQVRDLLKPNTAAVVVMYRKVTPDKTIAAIAPVRRPRAQELALKRDRAGARQALSRGRAGCLSLIHGNSGPRGVGRVVQ